MKKSIKIFANSLLIVSALGSNSIIANAEWKKDNTGWWYREENSWSVGWRLLDGKWYYFREDGYMKTGWLKDSNGKWYYLNHDGRGANNPVTVEDKQKIKEFIGYLNNYSISLEKSEDH